MKGKLRKITERVKESRMMRILRVARRRRLKHIKLKGISRKSLHFSYRSIGLKTLDIFILKKFLGTYFFATMLILAVASMFDVTEKLDAFLSAPLKETIFDYFMSFLPYFANQLAPLFTFISVIFFTTKLAGNSEIIAILSSGVSFNRLMRPYMIGAAVIAALTFVLSNYLIPPTNVKRIEYTNKYVKNTNMISMNTVNSPEGIPKIRGSANLIATTK